MLAVSSILLSVAGCSQCPSCQPANDSVVAIAVLEVVRTFERNNCCKWQCYHAVAQHAELAKRQSTLKSYTHKLLPLFCLRPVTTS